MSLQATDSMLFKPIQLGHLTLKHRVVMAPMGRLRTTGQHFDMPIPGLVKEYYSQRASTPGTLLVSESIFVASKAAGYPGVSGIWSDEQIAGWKEVVDAVHAKGSYIFAQLVALGRGAGKREYLQAYDPSYDVVSPGDIPVKGGEAVRMLTMEEIKEYIQLFAKAAANAVHRAGFDGVEIHGANGHLVNQFIEDVSNNRTDEYGGNIENRSRFVLELADAISKAVGEQRTSLRLSPWSRGGGKSALDMRMQDPTPAYSYLITELKNLHPNLAYLHIIEPRVDSVADVQVGDGESNEFIRRIWLPKPLISAGGYKRHDALEATREEGMLIAFGRHFLSNPDLPIRLEKDIPLRHYDRSTFYLVGDASGRGYTDYPFA
ncbi:hypothetical protein VNI00_000603 [Paramarasmius palmivorus]|uniref:NADH:flavin oxidoreductase/NADH oxidase N-terminal domain-containing protein n=1 Tax=Paramarasmius palmivorus TaxID=297713 RepID=A0AAW0E998_9AGAR